MLTWDDRINVTELDRLLQQRDFGKDTPIELLILSPCQTAAGDKRAVLGLAGVAVSWWGKKYGCYFIVGTG